MQVVPNPTWGPTSFRLNLFKPGSVELRVFDLEGRRVRRLVDEVQHGGWRELAWDGRDENGRRVATGIYFVEMGSPGVTTTRRVAVVR
jgi:flagellar hook assembly protein FlgD